MRIERRISYIFVLILYRGWAVKKIPLYQRLIRNPVAAKYEHIILCNSKKGNHEREPEI